MQTRAKRTREQAQLDDAGTDTGAPPKIPATMWAEEMLNIWHLTGERLLADMVGGYAQVQHALRAVGMCPAAVQSVTFSQTSVVELRDWPRWRNNPTRAALRTWDHTACPPQCKDGANCAWRIAPSELEDGGVSRFVAQYDAAATDSFFPLAWLPIELICHIVRMIAYDFPTLCALAVVSRTLRTIVADTLPNILVDCSILVRDPVPQCEWRLRLPVDVPCYVAETDAQHGKALTYRGGLSDGSRTFRNVPCTWRVFRVLSRPFKTLFVFGQYSADDWRKGIIDVPFVVLPATLAVPLV